MVEIGHLFGDGMDTVGFDMGGIKFRVEGLGLRVEFAGAKIGETERG